jgi:hypothetical protein
VPDELERRIVVGLKTRVLQLEQALLGSKSLPIGAAPRMSRASHQLANSGHPDHRRCRRSRTTELPAGGRASRGTGSACGWPPRTSSHRTSVKLPPLLARGPRIPRNRPRAHLRTGRDTPCTRRLGRLRLYGGLARRCALPPPAKAACVWRSTSATGLLAEQTRVPTENVLARSPRRRRLDGALGPSAYRKAASSRLTYKQAKRPWSAAPQATSAAPRSRW